MWIYTGIINLINGQNNQKQDKSYSFFISESEMHYYLSFCLIDNVSVILFCKMILNICVTNVTSLPWIISYA